jgi:Uma2 family endonuclease
MAVYGSDSGLGWMLFAPVDVVLSPHDVVQPDLPFVSAAKFAAAISTTPRYLGLPPDLVIEVLSHSTSRKIAISSVAYMNVPVYQNIG